MPFLVEPSIEIADRIDLALLANARGYRYAIEIGVDMGVFACQFLSRWHGEYMHLIDPYDTSDEFMGWDRTLDMMTATQALIPHHGRYKFVRAKSPGCADQVWWKVKPQLVYLDGDHSYEAVKSDIEAWWPRIDEQNGMLAGHDFCDDLPGVRRAVEEFARARGLVVRTTSEPDFPHSWYCYRSEPKTLFHQFFRKGESPNPHAGRR